MVLGELILRDRRSVCMRSVVSAIVFFATITVLRSIGIREAFGVKLAWYLDFLFCAVTVGVTLDGSSARYLNASVYKFAISTSFVLLQILLPLPPSFWFVVWGLITLYFSDLVGLRLGAY